MACAGDGWHKVGTNCKVYVKDRIIVECLVLDHEGNWKPGHVKRWSSQWHWYELTGMVTLAALRSGISRSTMTVGF